MSQFAIVGAILATIGTYIVMSTTQPNEDSASEKGGYETGSNNGGKKRDSIPKMNVPFQFFDSINITHAKQLSDTAKVSKKRDSTKRNSN